jgi:hypothetical protein
MFSQTNVDLVLVYLGDRLPRYVKENLKYLRENFPNHRIVFIGDSDRTLSNAIALHVEVFKTSNWRELQQETYAKLNHPMGFRSGFWFNTIARFFAIAEFQNVSMRPLIQIECDVFVAKNFPFTAFDNLKDSIAFPMENLTQGAASVLWVGSPKLSKNLADTALDLIHTDSELTDMTILGKIANHALISYVALPTIRTNKDLGKSIESQIFSENFKRFNGCFDALSYGMFLLGSDPRNNRGISELFKRRIEQVLPSNIRTLIMDKHVHSMEVTLETGVSYPLFCLHNHSKNVKLWTSSGYRYVNRRSKLLQKRQRVTFVVYPLTVIGMAFSKATRKLRLGG